MLEVSERRVSHVLGQHRSTQRKVPCGADDEEALTDDIIALAKHYGRYGYRRVTALLQAAGWSVNHKRVERIWRREGLKVPQRQLKRGRLWLNDGSCIRLRPEYRGHVWAYDFVEERTHDGRKFRISPSSTRPSSAFWPLMAAVIVSAASSSSSAIADRIASPAPIVLGSAPCQPCRDGSKWD